MIKAFVKADVLMKITQTGDVIHENLSMGPLKVKEVYEIGKESDFKHWDGTPFKVCLYHSMIKNFCFNI